jgi:hypothetical protein
MHKNPLIRKGLAVGIVLLFGMVVVVNSINATVHKTSINNLVEFFKDSNQLYTGNTTRHIFCFMKSGDVLLKNFQGRFYSIPIATNSGIRHFGIGTFQLDLVGWNRSRGASLTIAQFHRTSYYFHDVIINVRTFIGWYQSTDDLSNGELTGFALMVKINPLQRYSSYNISNENNQDQYLSMFSNNMTELAVTGLGPMIMTIKNIGNATAYNVSWRITTKGGFLIFWRDSSGVVLEPLEPGQEITVGKKQLLLGLGSFEIIGSAWADNAPMISVSHTAKLLLFFLIIS